MNKFFFTRGKWNAALLVGWEDEDDFFLKKKKMFFIHLATTKKKFTNKGDQNLTICRSLMT